MLVSKTLWNWRATCGVYVMPVFHCCSWYPQGLCYPHFLTCRFVLHVFTRKNRPWFAHRGLRLNVGIKPSGSTFVFVRVFFFRSGPDGLKPTPCFFWEFTRMHIQQNPSFRNAMRQLAISAGSLGSLGAAFCHVSFLSWWIDDHLPWFFGDQHGSASFAEKNWHTTSSKDMKTISINEHIDFA